MQALSRRHRAWLALLQVILLVAAVAMPAAASTSSDLLTGQKWLQLLQTYNIVRGNEQGDLKLDQPISRAEMTVIMVRALGAEQESKLFKGLSPFDDVKGHWADAEISYASIQKLVKGDGNGSFRPDSHITYAEALTLLLRLIGQEPTTGEWPFNVLLTAGDLGLVPMGVNGGNVSSEAVRGLIFQSLAKAAVDVKDSSGKNLLQSKLDQEPPKLTVAVPAQAESETLQISGSVKGAVAVTVNGTAVSLNNESFTSALTLSYGENPVTIVATDWAGNADTYSTKVVRPFPISVLTITGPDKVAPGAKATYTITALDNDGKPVSASLVTAKVEGAIGTFDKGTGVLTAATTPGATGKITVTAGMLSSSANVTILGQSSAATGLAIDSINGGQAVAYTKPMTVSVQITDAEGNLVTTDYGRPVTLKVSGLQGATVTPASANTVAGVATFTVKATQMGTVTLEATTAGLESTSKTAAFGSTRRIRLTADSTDLIVGSLNASTRIKAELLDEDGKPVNNDTGEIIEVRLSTTSEFGVLTDEYLTIARGVGNSTLSGNDGLFSVYGLTGGTATITGVISHGPAMTVDSVAVRATVPTIGPGTKLAAVASQVMLNAGDTTSFVIRLNDAQGNYIPTGSYAFQVKIDTSNNEAKDNGIPEGMTVTLGDTSLNPVSDGKAEGATDDTNDVVGMTVNGSAVVKVTYNKPGKITLTPIAMGATSKAYNASGEEGSASATTSFGIQEGSMLFVNPIGGITVTADSNLGTAQDWAALPNSTGSTVTLNVTLVDAAGYWIPAQSKAISLSRIDDGTQNTTPPANLNATTSDGKATYTVKGHANAGTDRYTVTYLGYTGTIDIYTQSAKPEQPVIAATRGYSSSGASLLPGSLNEVAPDEDGLQIVLDTVTGEKYVQAKVYAEGSNTPIYTTDAFDISSSEAMVLVPKAKLPAGTKRYAVVLRNGFGDSAKSEYSAQVLNSTYNTAITITSAKYDASATADGTKRLLLYGAGFSTSTTSPDAVDLSKIHISDASLSSSMDLSGATAVQISSASMITVTLSGGQAADLEDPTLFGGSDIKISADGGWYTKFNGQAASDVSDKRVTPGARVDHAVLDRANKRLQIIGEGFTTGEVVWSKLKLTYSGAPSSDIFTLDKMSPVRRSDTELVFTLTSAALTKLDTVEGYTVQVSENGWFRDTTAALSPAPLDTDLTIYTKLTLRSVAFTETTVGAVTTGYITVNGSNLNLADVFPGSFTIYDRGTRQTLSLAGASFAPTGTTITFTLTDEQRLALRTANFSGSDVYLRAADGWGEDTFGRPTVQIGDWDLVFPTMTRR